MAKKRKIQDKPAPEPEPEPEPVPKPSDEEEEEEEEEEEVYSSEEEEVEEEEDEEEEDDEPSEEEPSPAPNASGFGSTFDEVRALLAPFPKDQLISLLSMAAVTHPSVLRSIQDTADADTSHRNLFVHGIPQDATTAYVQSFFGRFGDVEHVYIATDRITGVSKGYAFVLFKTRAAAQKALDEPNKVMGTKTVFWQLASFGPPSAPPSAAVYEDQDRKIYVANVNPEVDINKLLDFFSTFGEIEKGPLGLDRVTGRPKGYVLFVYKTPEGAKRALESPRKEFMGQLLTCSMAFKHSPAAGRPHTASSAAVVHNPAVPAEGTKTEPILGKNNHFVAPPVVLPAARPVAPQALPGAGLRYSQPISASAPAANEELSQVVGQAVGQVLTAMGLDKIMGGAQAPAGNALIPPGHGGYGVSTVVQGGYGAGPHVHGEYGANPHVPGGHGAISQEQGRYGAGVQSKYGAGMQSVYGAGGPMQGGYGAGGPMQGGYGAGLQMQGGYGSPVVGRGGVRPEYPSGGYGSSVVGQGGVRPEYPSGGYGSPVVGRGGIRPEYPSGGYGGYRNLDGYDGYGNPPPYR